MNKIDRTIVNQREWYPSSRAGKAIILLSAIAVIVALGAILLDSQKLGILAGGVVLLGGGIYCKDRTSKNEKKLSEEEPILSPSKEIFSSRFDPPPLIAAVADNDYERAVRLIEEGADLDIRDDADNTALHRAAMNNDLKMVKLLLDRGAQIDAIGSCKLTPYELAKLYKSYSVLPALNLDEALLMAARNEDFREAEALIKSGAKPNLQDHWGKTALHYAAKHHNLEMVNLLLNNGGEKSVKDKEHRTPYQVGQLCGSDEIVLEALKITN